MTDPLTHKPSPSPHFDPNGEPIPYPEDDMHEAKPDLKPVSPTGEPLKLLTSGNLLKLAAVLVAVAGSALVEDYFPDTRVDEKVASVVLTIGTVLGIASPGIRKK